MSLQHKDYCTIFDNSEDRDILTRPNFDVNLRLMKTSPGYKAIIQNIGEYLLWNAATTKVGYKKPQGFSGANAGIPFNMIVAGTQLMLNPKIISARGSRRSLSNCGSLLLEEPITIERYEEVTFEFRDMNGDRHESTGFFPTVQHEIDHTQGVLILERRI